MQLSTEVQEALEKLVKDPSISVPDILYQHALSSSNLSQWLFDVYDYVEKNDTDENPQSDNPALIVNRIILGLCAKRESYEKLSTE